jgi:hypothetical protein
LNRDGVSTFRRFNGFTIQQFNDSTNHRSA